MKTLRKWSRLLVVLGLFVALPVMATGCNDAAEDDAEETPAETE